MTTIRALVAVLIFVAPSIGSASVMTMTFDGASHEVWIEDGITATQAGRYGGYIGDMSDGDGAALSWTDCGCPSAIEFVTGSLFQPIDVLLRPIESDYCATCNTHEELDSKLAERGGRPDDPIPYIWFTGYLHGILTSTFGLYLPQSDVYEPLSLAFLGVIDMLRIEAKSHTALGLPGMCTGNSCGQFLVDDLRLNSVPEPETLTLLALGVLGVWLGCRRRRAASVE